MYITRNIVLGLLVLVSLSVGSCQPNPQPPPAPQIIERIPLRPTSGPAINVKPALSFMDLERWEGEKHYYYTSHQTSAGGIYSNPYSMRIVVNAGFITGNRVFVTDAQGVELERIDIKTAPDANRDQFAVGVEQPPNPNDLFFYIIISPRLFPTNAIEHGKRLSYRIVEESGGGRAETPVDVTFVAPNRCLANRIDVSNRTPMKGDSVTVEWDAQGCKAAVVTSDTRTGTVVGPAPTIASIAGPFVFQRFTSQHDGSFSGSQRNFQIQKDTSYALHAIDAVWRRRRIGVEAKLQASSNTTSTTGCANNAPLQTFDFCAECPTGVTGDPPYRFSFPGYVACSQSDAIAELQGNFGGCTIKTSACP